MKKTLLAAAILALTAGTANAAITDLAPVSAGTINLSGKFDKSALEWVWGFDENNAAINNVANTVKQSEWKANPEGGRIVRVYNAGDLTDPVIVGVTKGNIGADDYPIVGLVPSVSVTDVKNGEVDVTTGSKKTINLPLTLDGVVDNTSNVIVEHTYYTAAVGVQNNDDSAAARTNLTSLTLASKPSVLEASQQMIKYIKEQNVTNGWENVAVTPSPSINTHPNFASMMRAVNAAETTSKQLGYAGYIGNVDVVTTSSTALEGEWKATLNYTITYR
ncbi:hypothetical protein ACIMS1_004454 [Vibrio harveyi]